ncbi:MAG: hypothetical protein KBT15_07460 [Bacteroidales bacterium]|nr:hypothetical protein [Candidatus Minthousia equi]
MIEISEYYTQAEETAANSNNISKWGVDNHIVFPFEGVNIGVFESIEYAPHQCHKAPALLPLKDLKGICYLYDSSDQELINNCLQTTALHLAAALPKGLCRIIAYDPIELGSNLIALSNVSPQITGGRILTDSREFSSALMNVRNRIPAIIQKVLGFKYRNFSLIEYNKENDHREPYTILVLSDFPNNYTVEQFELVLQILRNGKQAGVYVLMSYDIKYESLVTNSRENQPDFRQIMNELTTIYRRFDSYQIHNIPNENFFHKFTLRLEDNMRVLANLDTVYRKIQAKETAEERLEAISLFDNLPQSKDELWIRNSARAMMIPVGRDKNNEEVVLEITQKDAQNATVVVGMPGSGKSVFLNTLITSTAFYYSPKQVDLYLIDFSGVEFNVYAPKNLSNENAYILPHAKVIAPESEREFGISVLRKIHDEGRRRQRLFSDAGLSDFAEYWDYCNINGMETLSRVLVIVDEFQKFFDEEYDKIALEAEKIIKIIVKEYRKFGINLILATQHIGPYASKIDLGLIGNRVAFAWNVADGHNIFKGHEPSELIVNTGDCVYNKRSGAEDYNKGLRSYYVSPTTMRPKLKMIYDIAKQEGLLNKATFIFRSDAKVYMTDNTILAKVECKQHPTEVKVYVGENIEISEEHVYIPLYLTASASDDNILIIGGLPQVSERIAMNCARSICAYHTPSSARFLYMDFTSSDDLYHGMMEQMYNDEKDIHVPATALAEILQYLKQEIGLRQENPNKKYETIYITIVGLQYAFALMNKNYKPTEESQLIAYLLEEGPRIGLYTILQVDTLKSLSERVAAKAFDYFNHRIVLQMRSEDSEKIVGNKKASNLYIEGKDSSINRAYYYDKKMDIFTKFRPYELNIL